MSRQPQTCTDCARRKIRCNKVIPCENCTKRGAAHLCKRAEGADSGVRYLQSGSLSPGVSDLPGALGREESRASVLEESPVGERILTLVTSLSERIRSLESKIQGIESQKRPAPDGGLLETEDSTGALLLERPTKQARVQDAETPQAVSTAPNHELVAENYPSLGHNGTEARPPQPIPTARNDEPLVESNSVFGQNGLDGEAADAATVLEFLAWGRLKDSNLTSGIRDVPHSSEVAAYPDQAVIQAAQTTSPSPSSIPGSQIFMETMQIPQIQQLLPTKEQVYLLFQYHSDWLLFMHCAFHVEIFRGELDRFYIEYHGIINVTSAGLQWTALLFAIICGSMTSAKSDQLVHLEFQRENHAILAKTWYQASVECLNAARYQQHHDLYGVQAITTSTISAHMLGFSNSQSVLLASAVRIAQSLGLHRLGKSKTTSQAAENETKAEVIQREGGKRIWQQLATQDWFSVPFSETYCINPLHFCAQTPLHCDDNTMQPIPTSMPAISTYGNFLFKIASLMPAMLDRSFHAETIDQKYEQVLRFDRMMRDLVISQLPSCLNSQTPLDASWPTRVPVARRTLTIVSAHKIMMIHRRFLGMSFHDQKFSFTRRTCIAAAKTIANEMKQELPETLLFSGLRKPLALRQLFNRDQSTREHEEHRKLITETISILSQSVSISSIAARGTRLLTELLAEEKTHDRRGSNNTNPKTGPQRSQTFDSIQNKAERSLNVAAFVKKFCESGQPPQANSPKVTSEMPLWLQQENAFQPYSDSSRMTETSGSSNRGAGSYSTFHLRSHQQNSPYDTQDSGYQLPPTQGRYDHRPADSFVQAFSDSFDVRSVNWFDDLLGLAPSNCI